MNDLKKKIYYKLKRFGFSVVGFTKPIIEDNTIQNYDKFLKKKKFHGDMNWLEYHRDVKKNPLKIWNEVKTVISIGLNYAPGFNPLRYNKEKN